MDVHGPQQGDVYHNERKQYRVAVISPLTIRILLSLCTYSSSFEHIFALKSTTLRIPGLQYVECLLQTTTHSPNAGVHFQLATGEVAPFGIVSRDHPFRIRIFQVGKIQSCLLAYHSSVSMLVNCQQCILQRIW